MSFVDAASVLSAHVRLSDRQTVIDALLRLGLAHGAPVPVWPPRPLPYGMLISAPRNGWVSIWSPLENTRDWFPELTTTLECPGVILEVIQSQFWLAEFLRDGDFLGRMELPTEAVEYDDLWARTVDSLEAEGVEDPSDDEARFTARLDEIAKSAEYQSDLEHLREERPEPEDLAPFIPPHGSIQHAWELLTAIDRRETGDDVLEETSDYAETYLEDFASYLGIRDAAWDPAADAEALAEGDYEDEEGLPEGWRDFIVLPIPQLRMIQ